MCVGSGVQRCPPFPRENSHQKSRKALLLRRGQALVTTHQEGKQIPPGNRGQWPWKDKGSLLKQITGTSIAKSLSRVFLEEEGKESLRMDNAPYFRSQQVSRIMEEVGVKAVWSISYASYTNGVAERAVRTKTGS